MQAGNPPASPPLVRSSARLRRIRTVMQELMVVAARVIKTTPTMYSAVLPLFSSYPQGYLEIVFYMSITMRVILQYNSRCLIWSNRHDNRNCAPIWRGRNCEHS